LAAVRDAPQLCGGDLRSEAPQTVIQVGDNAIRRMVKSSLLERLGDLVAFPVEHDGVDPSRSAYERFAIPYTFKPRLSVGEAVIAASGALVRMLFAFWGTYSFLAWNATGNIFLRVLVLVALFASFAVAMALVMVAISALVKMVWPRRPRHP
jgi:hypothetical protein